MRGILGLTIAYTLLVGAWMFHVSENGSEINGVIFGEVLFSSPMLTGCWVAQMMKRKGSRLVMLFFAVAYPIVSALMYYKILTGEHDAQWQLTFFFIPMVGFAAVVIASAIAVAWRSPKGSV